MNKTYSTRRVDQVQTEETRIIVENAIISVVRRLASQISKDRDLAFGEADEFLSQMRQAWNDHIDTSRNPFSTDTVNSLLQPPILQPQPA